MKKILLTVFCVLGMLVSSALAWRSSLYPESWLPPGPETSFYTDAFLQDFSYAGYKRGEEPIPAVTGPVFDVTAYGADASGVSNSTAAIQATIDAAAAAGGGVVYLPAGTYLVEPDGASYALRISASDIVLRGAGVGQTFILNTSYEMRAKSVILVAPVLVSSGAPVAFTADLEGPTRRIPVADAGAFAVGDIVRMEWEFTQAWIDEHGQGTWWSESARPANAQYLREVMAVNVDEGWIAVDVPTRYTMRTRDHAHVFQRTGMLTGVGIEDFSIGNVQHPGTEFGENDYTVAGTAGYEVHASWLISLRDTHDSWVREVESYQAEGNTSTCHMLSNGLSLVRSFRVTVRNAAMRRAQYGGGGGNGYMFRVQHSNENLLEDCIADFSRHGYSITHAGTSGNVFRRCDDRETRRATGSSGSYQTSGSGSDHHMHFSHSNLIDDSSVHNSYWEAQHRIHYGTIGHALTSAHGVFWNMRGSGSYSTIVISEQGRYGYVIGTSGAQSGATNPTGGNTAPADILEGIGQGATLEPQSLSQDQFAKRMQGVLVSVGENDTVRPTVAYPLSGSVYTYGSGPVSSQWVQVSGPTAVFADAYALETTVELLAEGVYEIALTAWDGDVTNSAMVTITIDNAAPFLVPRATAHFIRGQAQNELSKPLGYFASTSDLAGTSGGGGDIDDRNVIFGYTLPTLPVGGTLTEATFAFEITQARDSTGAANLPDLQVYLLNVEEPSATGTNLFYHGPLDAAVNVIQVGTTNVTISGMADNDFDPAIEVAYTLTGDALDVLQSFYNGHTPTQSNVYFRFNMSQRPDLSSNIYRRYRVSTASDRSALMLTSVGEILALLPAGAVTDSGATLRATLSAPGTNYIVHAYWGTTDGGTNMGSWMESAALGSWSDVAFTNINHQISDLVPDTDYWFTFSATHDGGVVWPADSMPFTTFGPAAAGLGSGASGATSTSALLHGILTAGGSAQAWICWGGRDAGTTGTNAWEHVVALGEVQQDDLFHAMANDLMPNHTYWYRVYVANAYGAGWSSAAGSFSGTPAAAAGTWTPAELLPRGWYDASDLETIGASGGAVDQWGDKSGNSNHLAQTDSAFQPTTGSSMINGLNVLDFAQDYIFTANGLGANISSVFMVTSNNVEIASSTPGMLLLSTAGGEISTGDGYGSSSGILTNRVIAVLDEDTPNVYVKRQGVSSNVVSSIPVSANLYTYALDTDWFIGFNGSGNLRDLTSGTNRNPMLFADSFSIGAGARRHPTTVEFFYDGSVGEVILLDAIVAAEDRQKVEGYLAHKWGLVGNLPGGHLYKSSAPGGGAIANLAPAEISASQAELRGALVAEGTNYTVSVHWGLSDGGTNAGAWATSAEVGTWGHVTTNISYGVEGLAADTTHWYTFSASNASGVVWAEPSWRFATQPTMVTPGVTENYAIPHDWLLVMYPDLSTPAEFEAAALADYDHDGIPNWQEYWSGTDPMDSTSVLRIAEVTLQDGQIALSWVHAAVAPGLPPIAIQIRTNLLAGEWDVVGEFTPVDGDNNWAWTNAIAPNTFFRFAVTNAPAGP